MVYDNIILLLACKEAVKRALSRTERRTFSDGKKLFHGQREGLSLMERIIPLTERRASTYREQGFHCEIGKLLAYEIKVLISLTGTMLLEYGF